MYRVQQSHNSEYRNLDLSQQQFVDIVTGADITLGTAVWNPETMAYVSNITADEATVLYSVCFREVYP